MNGVGTSRPHPYYVHGPNACQNDSEEPCFVTVLIVVLGAEVKPEIDDEPMVKQFSAALENGFDANAPAA